MADIPVRRRDRRARHGRRGDGLRIRGRQRRAGHERPDRIRERFRDGHRRCQRTRPGPAPARGQRPRPPRRPRRNRTARRRAAAPGRCRALPRRGSARSRTAGHRPGRPRRPARCPAPPRRNRPRNPTAARRRPNPTAPGAPHRRTPSSRPRTPRATSGGQPLRPVPARVAQRQAEAVALGPQRGGLGVAGGAVPHDRLQSRTGLDPAPRTPLAAVLRPRGLDLEIGGSAVDRARSRDTRSRALMAFSIACWIAVAALAAVYSPRARPRRRPRGRRAWPGGRPARRWPRRAPRRAFALLPDEAASRCFAANSSAPVRGGSRARRFRPRRRCRDGQGRPAGPCRPGSADQAPDLHLVRVGGLPRLAPRAVTPRELEAQPLEVGLELGHVRRRGRFLGPRLGDASSALEMACASRDSGARTAPSPSGAARRAAAGSGAPCAACRFSVPRCFSTSKTMSSMRVRFCCAASSFSSAARRRALYFVTPAASSISWRRSVGRELRIMPDLALLDDRVGLGAEARVHQQIVDVAQPARPRRRSGTRSRRTGTGDASTSTSAHHRAARSSSHELRPGAPTPDCAEHRHAARASAAPRRRASACGRRCR